MWGIGWARDGKSLAWGTDNTHDENGHSPLEGTFRFDDFGPGGQPDASKYQQAVLTDDTYALKRIGLNELDTVADCREWVLAPPQPVEDADLVAALQ